MGKKNKTHLKKKRNPPELIDEKRKKYREILWPSERNNNKVTSKIFSRIRETKDQKIGGSGSSSGLGEFWNIELAK